MSTLPREVIAELSARICLDRAERNLRDLHTQQRERLMHVRPVRNDLDDAPPFRDEAQYLHIERRWAQEHLWVGAGLLLGLLSWAALAAAVCLLF